MKGCCKLWEHKLPSSCSNDAQLSPRTRPGLMIWRCWSPTLLIHYWQINVKKHCKPGQNFLWHLTSLSDPSRNKCCQNMSASAPTGVRWLLWLWLRRKGAMDPTHSSNLSGSICIFWYFFNNTIPVNIFTVFNTKVMSQNCKGKIS